MYYMPVDKEITSKLVINFLEFGKLIQFAVMVYTEQSMLWHNKAIGFNSRYERVLGV